MTISTQTEQVQWGFHDHQHSDRAGTVGGSIGWAEGVGFGRS